MEPRFIKNFPAERIITVRALKNALKEVCNNPAFEPEQINSLKEFVTSIINDDKNHSVCRTTSGGDTWNISYDKYENGLLDLSTRVMVSLGRYCVNRYPELYAAIQAPLLNEFLINYQKQIVKLAHKV